MLGTLVQIAEEMVEYEANQKGVDRNLIELNRLCQDPGKKGKVEVKVLVIDLDTLTVQLEDYKNEERYKYLLAGLSKEEGNKPIGPSWVLDVPKKEKLTKDKIENTLKGIKSALKELESLDKDGEDLVKRYSDLLSDVTEKGKIVEYIVKKADLNPNTRLLVIVQVGKKKPGEIDSIAISVTRRRLFGGRRAESRGSTFCAVCGKETMVQASLPFGDFFTVEKIGFAPMALEAHVWKYASLCKDCTKWLYISKDYLSSHLSTRVAGKQAYIIPNLEPGASGIKGQFIRWLWELGEETKAKGKKVKPVPKEFERFPEKEDLGEDESEGAMPNLLGEFIEKWSDFSPPPFRSASIIFYEPGQKFKFLYATSDVLPKQLREAGKSLKQVREILRKGALGDMHSNLIKKLSPAFEFIGDAWRWPRKGQEITQGTLKLTPMHLVEAILTQKPPKESVFWSDIDNILRALYTETVSGNSRQTLRQAIEDRIALLWALWGLIYVKDNGGENMSKDTLTLKSKALSSEFWDDFFRDRKMLDSDAKRAMFLIGVLFGRVESLQRRERQSKTGEMPIISRLRGLTISKEEIVQKLYPELKLKLRQLSGSWRSVREIEQAAADFLSRAGDLSDEEARFYFCLGWSLEWLSLKTVGEYVGLKPEEEEETEEEEIEEGGV